MAAPATSPMSSKAASMKVNICRRIGALRKLIMMTSLL